MKKYLVFSDIHGDALAFENLKELSKDLDGIIFAGDGYSSVKNMTDGELLAVGGNCDMGGPPEIVTEIEGVRLLICHGHRYHVKSDMLSLTLRARSLDCQTVIFGHTHIPLCSYEYGGALYLNPGTCSRHGAQRTYAVLTLDKGEARADIYKLF